MSHIHPVLRQFASMLLALLLCSSPAVVLAQSASDASVAKLLATNGAQQSLERALAGMQAQLQQQIQSNITKYNAGAPLTRQQRVAVDQAVPQIAKILQERLGWQALKPTYIRIYQSQLSQPEVDRLIALYQDPHYVRIVDKMQVVNQQAAQLMLQQMPGIMQAIQPQLESAVQKALLQ